MTSSDYRDPRLTERRNPRTTDIDVADAATIVDLMNAEDRTVSEAVAAQRDVIAQAVERATTALAGGGRVIYVGAGTSGRLGVLDASECPPTFGTPPEMVVGVIAGGPAALVRSQEGAEDDREAGAAAIDALRVGATDFVIGIAASGTTPYVAAAVGRANALGAHTAVLCCSDPPSDLTEVVDLAIVVRTGPEVLTGSTRLKAGTATKLVLNTISTGAMIRLGKAYGNLMVDLTATSQKLEDRGERIVMEVTGVDRVEARRAIEGAEGRVKVAIVMIKRGVDATEARRLLAGADGVMRNVIGAPPAAE